MGLLLLELLLLLHFISDIPPTMNPLSLSLTMGWICDFFRFFFFYLFQFLHERCEKKLRIIACPSQFFSIFFSVQLKCNF